MEFLLLIILVAPYVYGGDRSIRYLKYHVLGVQAEFYSDTGEYMLSRFIWAVILGWATIPAALLHYLVSTKQYKPAGALVAVIILVVIFVNFHGKKSYTPPAHQTPAVTSERPKPKPKPKEDSEQRVNESRPQQQPQTQQQPQQPAEVAKEIYVGSYGDGTQVYLLTDTVKRAGNSVSCTVRAGQTRLDYHFDGQNYSNSEGYHGNINDGESPVARAIYNYVTAP